MNFAHRTFRRGSATASLTLGGAMLGFDLDFWDSATFVTLS